MGILLEGLWAFDLRLWGQKGDSKFRILGSYGVRLGGLEPWSSLELIRLRARAGLRDHTFKSTPGKLLLLVPTVDRTALALSCLQQRFLSLQALLQRLSLPVILYM